MTEKRRSRVTLQQVANHAGVSRATASLVVRGSPHISKETREKVLNSMKELGYVYDRVAANLRSHRSSTVGLIITEIGNPFFSDLLAGVHESLDQEGYTVILGTTFDSPAKQDELLSTMLEYRVGGVIMSPVPGCSVDMVERLKQWGIPVVLVAREELPMRQFDYVGIDNVAGGRLATKHLIQQGHRRIAFIGGFSGSSVWRDRKKGYCEALEQAGIELDESLLIQSLTTRKGGMEAMKRALELPNPPTAAFCYNDVVAFGAMLGLKEVGMMPGRDIAIVGFDNIQESAIFHPPLTTIAAFPERIGVHAAHILHKRMTGETSEPKRLILQPELVVRESSSGIPHSS
ncbi:LacI family transcriptional regulator [Anoxybacillus tepidamans]|uniref:LacI family transcriptional regulator n=1 Tax=Anoxybacteroides tepidamans TaxID=265948 RepID=A0A7W8IM60_9BACL|nr:LacI family DNA-binding transcriptional regulator [Anoxybacillus tepidamans]MBB5323136.1 LacI family transcriptional regulator [Anoxybacillus tepidamans]